MTAQYVIEHVLLAVQMSNGKLTVECFNSEEKLPMLNSYLLSQAITTGICQSLHLRRSVASEISQY